MTFPRFLPAGDTALVVELGDSVDREVNRRVMRLHHLIEAEPPEGLAESVPTFRSLMLHYDPLATSQAALRASVEPLLADLAGTEAEAPRVWGFPTCYEGELAPDLADVAERTGLSTDEVVRLHAGTRYYVYMLGAFPGFGFLGELPEALSLPRRTSPRIRVPAGSVAITGQLTAIYPLETPGGWNLIGRTPVPLFDTARDPPAALLPGDGIEFQPIGRTRYDELLEEARAGRLWPKQVAS